MIFGDFVQKICSFAEKMDKWIKITLSLYTKKKKKKINKKVFKKKCPFSHFP